MTDGELEYMSKIRNRTLHMLEPKGKEGFGMVRHEITHVLWPQLFDGMMKHMGYEYDEKAEQYVRKEGDV